ncbi:SHOCT domain-containing protein [Methanobrevibacter sp.]
MIQPLFDYNNDDFITKLEKLVALYEKGLLTDEEFTKMKRKLI